MKAVARSSHPAWGPTRCRLRSEGNRSRLVAERGFPDKASCREMALEPLSPRRKRGQFSKSQPGHQGGRAEQRGPARALRAPMSTLCEIPVAVAGNYCTLCSFTQHALVSSQLWGPEVQSRSVDRAGVQPGALREGPSHLFQLLLAPGIPQLWPHPSNPCLRHPLASSLVCLQVFLKGQLSLG